MAQKPMAVYYFTNYGYLLPGIEGADYYVTIYPPDSTGNKGLPLAKGFFVDGKLKYISHVKSTTLIPIHLNMTGFFQVPLQGSYTSFFPNGNKMSVITYENGEPRGSEQDYYPNGALHSTRTYTSDSTSICGKCLDTAGQVMAENGNGKWLNYLDGGLKTYLVGSVVNGLEQGEWEGRQDDSLKIKGIYKDGRLKVTYFNKADKKIYLRLDTVPEFPGGIRGFYNYLVKNVHYPADARQNNIQGKVEISFISETDGSLDELGVFKSVSKSIDEEALRVVRKCPKWRPGIVDGKPVCVFYYVPINFILGDK